MQNRRSFLKNSTIALAGGFALSQDKLPRASAQTVSLNTNILAAASASHITAAANVYAGTETGVEWKNMSNAATSVYKNMQLTSFDTTLKSAISGVSSSQLSINDLDSASIVESIQVYQPDFQLSDLNKLLSLIPTDQTSLATALTKLQTNGLSSTVYAAAYRV
jgi:hypothetical protein